MRLRVSGLGSRRAVEIQRRRAAVVVRLDILP